MPYKDQWAYEFQCDSSLEEICEQFNVAGTWQWQLRENYVFGDYLNSRPEDGVHVKVHFFPQALTTGSGKEGFAAVLRIEKDYQAARIEVDIVFKSLLEGIEAKKIREVEPYD